MNEGRAGQAGRPGQAGWLGRAWQAGRAAGAGIWFPRQSMKVGPHARVLRAGIALLMSLLLGGYSQAADDPRAIVEEVQRRSEAKSQRYEGLLQVVDARGKVSDKRWTL